jgi:polysaccharide biosynthesis/export protein
MKKKLHILNLCGVLFIMFSIISCVPVKQLSFFNDINDLKEPVVNPKVQKTILPFDKLYIKILSTDPQTSQIFNFSEEMRFSGSGNGILGYIVDEAGSIDFPFAGKINVGNMTTAEAAVKIQTVLNEYIPKSSVTVKFIDNQVSVLGEVGHQGTFNFTQDKINIYEALALGGGLSRYGDRRNVILIRQEGDKIMHHRLNLSDSKIAGKNYYYVLPNDVIVVEPLKSISSSYTNNTYTTILTTVTTFIAVLLFIQNVKF